MTKDRENQMKSIILNKKTLVIALAVIAVTFTLSASAFMDDNRSAKGYERNQALSGANDCGEGELAFNVLCQNEASQVQGDENAVGLAGTQEGGTVEQPYENLVDEVTVQTVIDDQGSQIADMRASSAMESRGAPTHTAAESQIAMPTPGAEIWK
jgi:hypothetical protein